MLTLLLLKSLSITLSLEERRWRLISHKKKHISEPSPLQLFYETDRLFSPNGNCWCFYGSEEGLVKHFTRWGALRITEVMAGMFGLCTSRGIWTGLLPARFFSRYYHNELYLHEHTYIWSYVSLNIWSICIFICLYGYIICAWCMYIWMCIPIFILSIYLPTYLFTDLSIYLFIYLFYLHVYRYTNIQTRNTYASNYDLVRSNLHYEIDATSWPEVHCIARS